MRETSALTVLRTVLYCTVLYEDEDKDKDDDEDDDEEGDGAAQVRSYYNGIWRE